MDSRLRALLAPAGGDRRDMRRRLVIVYVTLALAHAGAWAWAIAAFENEPVMLGVALVVYGLGLRHAIDADHIAAIDNVTRKLMREGERPIAVGFFFALGHSSIVLVVTALIAYLAVKLEQLERYRDIGGSLGTAISAVFFIAVAAMNIAILLSLYASYRQMRGGMAIAPLELERLLEQRGLLTRFLRPVFRLITRSWHMFPLGMLFGLGFDTATEVAMFGVSAAHAAQGIPVSAILVLPVLFAAGMALVDTTDGVMMLGIYDWAAVNPMRKIYYNMTITSISVVVALLIGGAQIMALLEGHVDPRNIAVALAELVETSLNGLGATIIGLFVASCLFSLLIHRRRRDQMTSPPQDTTPGSRMTTAVPRPGQL